MSITKDYDHLLIDGKNSIYRAIFAGYYDDKFKSKGIDYFTIFVKFMHKYLDTFTPKNIHVFWDAPSGTTWRKALYQEYKENRGSLYEKYDIDVKKEVDRQMQIAIEVLHNMGIRQYYTDKMEADDLVYAFCRVRMHDRIMIVSSDADYRQITYQFRNIDLHSPLNKNKRLVEEIPRLDPILVKAFCGDKSDNINGYYGIGKVKSQALISDLNRRKVFFESNNAKIIVNGKDEVVGEELFKRNRQLIDLSLCPDLLDNMMYIEKRLTSQINFDYSKVIDSLNKRKVAGIILEANQYIKPFKRLVKNGSTQSSPSLAAV